MMGQVRKENIRDKWSTDPMISTSIFPHTMSRKCFESTWQAWHFSDNSHQTKDSEQLFKMWPMYEYYVQKFRSVYSPKQEMSLDEAMIPWQGHLKFRTYKPGKIKYGVLVKMVRQYQVTSVTWRYTELRGRRRRTVLLLLKQKLRPKSSHLSGQFL